MTPAGRYKLLGRKEKRLKKLHKKKAIRGESLGGDVSKYDVLKICMKIPFGDN